jgi:NAD(P)-dependent dehydrogenase (short-subunit alcohol dehydrogenase family)
MPGGQDGRVALVTGAGQGIGRAIALRLAADGAAGLVLADLSEAAAKETADLVRAAAAESAAASGPGTEVEAVACDLRERDGIAALAEHCDERFGGLDVLVNNAGIIETQLTGPENCAVDTLPEEVWDEVYRVNLRAPWLLTKFAAPLLRRSQHAAAIVNVASVSGLTGFRSGPAYCTTKGGLVQLTKVTAVDLAPDVRCNCVCPGVIDTPMARAFIATAPDPAAREREMTADQLVERLGRAEEVAALVAFLASDAAGFITGHAYPLDGGALAWRGRRDPA